MIFAQSGAYGARTRPTGLEPVAHYLATYENMFFPLAKSCSIMQSRCHEAS